MAFVLIPHLNPSHESMMVNLLSKCTTMPVIEAKQGMAVEPNSLYVIPPNYFLAIRHGNLQLSNSPNDLGGQTSIDFFLRSLAEDQAQRAIGIVLSGTGSHGSLGARQIKTSGGMVMAQRPDTAEYDQMPLNAIKTGIVDFVLPPEQMPEALISYWTRSSVGTDVERLEQAEGSSEVIDQIFGILQTQEHYDFRVYRKPMVLRRIQRRMGIVGVDSLPAYLLFIQNRPDEATALFKDLLINVTAFFRDPEAYQFLEKEVLPALIATHDRDLPIRVWIAGCSTGEEAYSLAIVLREAISNAKSSLVIQLFASDIDIDALEIARTGVYPASIAADVSAERLEKFFIKPDDEHYQINKDIRDSVVFSHQNLIGDPPFSKLDLISCRNLLIYFEPEVQKNVISLFHFALTAGGTLFLGPSETIGRRSNLFETISKKWRVYRRSDTAKRELINLPMRKSTDSFSNLRTNSPLSLHRKRLKDITEQLILSDHAPAAALCNHALEVLYVTGPLVDFLEFPRGELTKDLLAMSRPGLRTKLRTTCRSAMREGKTISATDVRVNRGGHYFKCSITARPLFEPKEVAGLLLVLFHHQNSSPEIIPSSDASCGTLTEDAITSQDSQLDMQLEIELNSMSEELHSTIEEMESSNEELKSSNEEIMSVNEELQSVNEELESSKEELQSLNEELTTVNGQLLEKVNELNRATSDLTNLMASTEIATVFLDRNLAIKLFTPPTKALLNLLSTDIGRPLRDIAPNFSDDTMLLECRQVLASEESLEREVQTEGSKTFLRRILPYRNSENQIAGLVITFIDLTQRKKLEAAQRDSDARHFEELHESAERLQAILNTAADAIITIDLMGTIESMNLATGNMFQYGSTELIGSNIASLLPTLFQPDPDQSTSKTISTKLIELLGTRCEVQAQRKDKSFFPIELALSRVDHLGLYTGILRDVTVQKQLQSHVLQIATDEQMRIGQELHDGTQQELTGLSLFAGAINDLLDKANAIPESHDSKWQLRDVDYQRIRRSLEKLTQGLIEANQHVHKLSHGIMPIQIEADGLKSALAHLASTTNDNHKIQCQFSSKGEGTIRSSAVATQLYRIAQESLTNSIKHGKASDIQIVLKDSMDRIVLEISDNGIGFDPEGLTGDSLDGDGQGLRIMRYRTSILGGELLVKRNERNGTTVRCSIPNQRGLT